MCAFTSLSSRRLTDTSTFFDQMITIIFPFHLYLSFTFRIFIHCFIRKISQYKDLLFIYWYLKSTMHNYAYTFDDVENMGVTIKLLTSLLIYIQKIFSIDVLSTLADFIGVSSRVLLRYTVFLRMYGTLYFLLNIMSSVHPINDSISYGPVLLILFHFINSVLFVTMTFDL